MKNIIERIWDNYQVEISETLTAETKKIHHDAVEKQKNLYNALNEKQIALLEEYLEIQNRFQSIADKNCFIDGVKFGIRFILEATTDNR